MSRSQTTGAYTRVDNSFSNPVVGTTISPTDADTFFDDVEACMNSFIATSTTSLAIGTGAKTFTVASDVANKVFLANTQIHAFSLSGTSNYMDCTVTSYNNSTGELVTDCFAVGGSGTKTDWVIISSGARGATGATGATGDRAGFKYTFNTATSGDPGSGKYLFNNATFMSATAFNISETDGEGANLASLLATLDDSTNTTKCLLVWINADGSKGHIGYLTGTITDNGTYDTFSFTPVTSFGSPANNDVFRLQTLRIGDKGADGSVAGPGVSVDSEIALWSGTGGATLKRASTTGILKGTSGVLSAATAGTDYMHPGTTSTLTKGFTFTPNNIGTVSSGTTTPDPTNGNYQYYTNNGAHTFAAYTTADHAMDILITNGASAGAITFSGFTVASGNTGDALTTTNTNKFILSVRRINGTSTYVIKALQ